MNGAAVPKVVVLHWAHPSAHRDDTVVERPESVLGRVAESLRRALPHGLPRALEHFYAACDGIVVTSGVRTFTVVGLEAMFGRDFPAPVAAIDRTAGESALRGGPFRGKLYDLRRDRDGAKQGAARLDLLVRLRLVASIDRASAIAVDLFGREGAARLYYVHYTHGVWPLDLRFDDLVRCAERYGARRWYLAFLSARATRTLGIDAAHELETSMAPFPGWQLEARSRRTSSTPPPSPEQGRVTVRSRTSACRSPTNPATTIGRWFLSAPELDLEPLDDPYARDRAVLLKEGGRLVGEGRTVSLVATTLRAWLRAPTHEPLVWGAVLLAATELADDEVVRLAELGMPSAAMAVLAKLRGWNRAKLSALAESAGSQGSFASRAVFAAAAKRI